LYSLDTSSKDEGLYGILQNDFAFIKKNFEWNIK
jgi:hypothetical protein